VNGDDFGGVGEREETSAHRFLPGRAALRQQQGLRHSGIYRKRTYRFEFGGVPHESDAVNGGATLKRRQRMREDRASG
jgi:hypothetical protein